MESNASYISDSVVAKADGEVLSAATSHQIRIHHSETTTEEKRITEEKKRYGYLFFKRAFDIVASFFGLVLLSPLFLAVSAVIRIESEGKALFSQVRIGKDGEPFTFYKFRSMHKDAEYRRSELIVFNEMDGPVFKMVNDPRITRVGKFLRKTSIDELPQLFNILKGDMSFVGPRPPLPNEVEQYSDYHMRRLEVKGGLTCYWQVNGRSDVVLFDEWVHMDVKYIEERSVLVDMKILFKTFKVVLFREGAC